ncbi:methionine--tRNA ligase, partial [Candidatus Shapirobacteria bacterium CG10_big_fil_rev_8_21_14_0_10_38_8]
GVDDISISREKVSWGIPCPWDKKHTIYVWVEALLNYYTATQFVPGKKDFWPADLHTMAKDILWFHTVIWEALLIAADLPVPKQIFIHSFYLIDGQKMSKSLGNVISPQQLLEKFGADATRYLIASSFPFDKDSNVGLQKFTEKYNADLANGLGNLVARVTKLCENNNLQFSPIDLSIFRSIETNKILQAVDSFLREYKLSEALTVIWMAIKGLDSYIDKERPWELTSSEAKKRLDIIIRGSESIRSLLEIAYALAPFMPETAKKIEKQFSGPKIISSTSLFPRI